MALSLMEGNEAIARGALAAGCRFFAGYPITPASTVLTYMLNMLPPVGGICLQAEDEIASIGACLGASMSGLKVMTATSGPGISLYSEQISFAIGSEIPLVIVDVQRLGPSTGSATRGADSDVNFLRWGNSGGLPVIVLAPVNAADCFTLTVEAFNLAEKFRCPDTGLHDQFRKRLMDGQRNNDKQTDCRRNAGIRNCRHLHQRRL